MNKPKIVSVIIPNYNYADFIIERIDSVISQTYPISELIILDDASTDNSVEIINKKIVEIKKENPKLTIKLLLNQKNSGGCVFSQWQKGLKEATGDYFWIAEADDSCNKKFLANAIEKMEKDEEIKLFFSDSKRINQNGKIISPTCTDMTDMWKSGHWKKDYVADGKEEIKKYLSGQIFIMNVSSVLWKNEKRCLDIFEEAKKYKVAGDWYIYSRILEEGKIAYCAKPLNYFRKHNKGSASTLKNRTHEYDEVYEIQEIIRKKYKLTKEEEKWQIIRRRGMGFTENEKNIGTKGRIAWLVPCFSQGSGGHRTIFQNVNFLISNGHQCDIYVDMPEPGTAILKHIEDWYGEFKGDVFQGFELSNREYDLVLATGWNTAKYVAESHGKNKLYFIQDYEPWFFPMNEKHIAAEQSYKYGLEGVTIGRWLAHKINHKYHVPTRFFNFCADTSTYHPIKNTKKEKAVCLIFQLGKARRCDELALRSLEIVKKINPDIKIYLFGSAKRKINGLDVEHLGVLTTKECNALYNKCAVGLSMSASNPSRIPFEMMSAGLPVVEIYAENNLYDLPEEGCLLAEPSPEAIASAILRIINDTNLQKEMGQKGHEYMKDYPLERGFNQFLKIVEDTISGVKTQQGIPIKQSYNKAPIKPIKEAIRISQQPSYISFSSVPTYSELIKRGTKYIFGRTKKTTGKILRSMYRKIKYGPNI